MTTSQKTLLDLGSMIMTSLSRCIQALETGFGGQPNSDNLAGEELARYQAMIAPVEAAKSLQPAIPMLPISWPPQLEEDWVNDRMSRDEMFMRMAEVISHRSTCFRTKVGVVVTDSNGYSIVSMGYNGNARGLPNQCDSATPGQCGCVHAETNALIKAPFSPTTELTLYSTLSPCVSCSKLILNSAVTRVVYRQQYRDVAGVQLLASQGITVCHVTSRQ